LKMLGLPRCLELSAGNEVTLWYPRTHLCQVSTGIARCRCISDSRKGRKWPWQN
jgi:hypothetical protein